MRIALKKVLAGTALVASVGALAASPAFAGVTANLLGNPGAESGSLSSWTLANTGWSTSSIAPIAGVHSFVPTVLADSIQLGQRVDLSPYAADIAGGTVTAQFGGSGTTGDAALVEGMLCKITLSLGFRTAANDPTANQIDLDIVTPGVHSGQQSVAVPVGTDHVEVWITGRNIDFNNNAQPMTACVLQADELFFTITAPSVGSAPLPPTGLTSLAQRIAILGGLFIVVGVVATTINRRTRRHPVG